MADREVSSGLLINVVRTLTTSASDDQRELAKQRIEKGHAASGLRLDQLLKEHEGDVKQSVSAFRDVYQSVRGCRERINAVQNALQTSKALLQSRREELKKLWAEDLEQKRVCKILQQIHELKNLDKLVERLVREQRFREAGELLKKAEIELNGPLASLEGLAQLRANVLSSSQTLLSMITEKLLQWLVVEPFDRQLLELAQTLPEWTAAESAVVTRLADRYLNTSEINNVKSTAPTVITMPQRPLGAQIAAFIGATSATDGGEMSAGFMGHQQPLAARLADALSALTVFGQLDAALGQLRRRRGACCTAAVNDLVALMAVAPESSGGARDAQLLHTLIKRLINRFYSMFTLHRVLADELRRLNYSPPLPADDNTEDADDSKGDVLDEFWACVQAVMQAVVSDHVDCHPVDGRGDGRTAQTTNAETRTLFRFANTASWASTSSTTSKQPLTLICAADPYNIVEIFDSLNAFCSRIESLSGMAECSLHTFLHNAVMHDFLKHIKQSMDRRLDAALADTDVWTALATVAGHPTRVLSSSVAVAELCNEIGTLIRDIGTYTPQFASFWVLVMEEYTRTAQELYKRITHSRVVQGESMTEHPKISATWASDTDISRLLKSLPSWSVLCPTTPSSTPSIPQPPPPSTPSALSAAQLANGLQETEQTVRQRTQRESEILISNFGVQNEIERRALITDVQHARAIACAHESLQWFCGQMRALIEAIPPHAQSHLKRAVEITSPDGKKVEQVLRNALESRLATLEAIAETCLLMMHLELRVHCFYHLLPLARPRSIAGASGTGASTASIVAATRDDTDPEVTEFGRDLQQFHQLLQSHIAPRKVKYLFDGLGHLCASIFINSSQHLPKLPESSQKRVCRNIFVVQRHLSQISGRAETELHRAQQFFELVSRDPDELLARILESGPAFSTLEYTYLIALAVRTNTSLSAQPGVLDRKLKQLQEVLAVQGKK